jgi:hypothetical protein
MKSVRQIPFGNYKITDSALENLPVSSDPSAKEKNFEFLKKSIGNFLFMIDPQKKETWFCPTVFHKNRLISSYFYDPVLMFLNQALLFQYSSIKVLEEAEVYNRFENIEMINPQSFSYFLQLKFSTIIVLHAAIDSFLNSVIPDTMVEYGDKTKTKKDWEHSLHFKDKLKLVSSINKINFDMKRIEDKGFYDTLIVLNGFRNDIVHFKTYKTDQNIEIFVDKIEGVLRVDIENHIDNVIKIMNRIKPEYVQLIDISDVL